MKSVRLLTCENPIEANIIKGRLENEGINCFLTNENFSNLMPHYNRILGAGVQIMISETDFEKAIELLEINVRKELVCPNCNSKNIKVSLGKNKAKKIFAVFLSLFSGVPFNNISSINRCADCKTEF
jgi:DNA-directed RNA polymerase subunit RPC12/RpoP